MTTLYQRLRELLSRACHLGVETGLLLQPVAAAEIALERPRQSSHGDLATNLCFSISKGTGKSPRAVAEAFVPLLRAADTEGWIAAAEVAGPGFLNLRLSETCWNSAILDTLQGGAAYGTSQAGHGEKVLLEFVSANPTGPLHVGHGRGAVLGDALGRVMRAAGYDVSTEYYINNVGNQVSKLGESVWHWLRAEGKRAAALEIWSRGEPVAFPDGFPEGFPEDGYRGGYIAQCAQDLAHAGAFSEAMAAVGSWADDTAWREADPASLTGRADNRTITVKSWQKMLERIRIDLERLDIRFDRWFSERGLHGLDADTLDSVSDCARRLVAQDWAYEGEPAAREGDDEEEAGDRAIFFRGTSEKIPKSFRDSKDRVIVRGDGRPTYFAADIAYHDQKLARGYDRLINILGADHHGYVSRLKGVLHALGDLRAQEGDPLAARWSGERLEVLLVQMVALLRDGKPVPMGKRSGEFITLRDVIDDVTTSDAASGRDAVRFIFLLRKADAQLDFDLEVARRTSMDNPVYYVQYGHARLASILDRARSEGKGLRDGALPTGLHLDDERELALLCAELPETIARAARSREPHQVAYYLTETCRAFHAYYTRNKADNRVITDDDATTQSRLLLVAALKQVLHNGLTLLGVSAPDRMVSLQEAGAEGSE